MKDNVNKRLFVLAVIFVLFGFIILYHLFSLQVVRGDEYKEYSNASILREKSDKAPRGKIMDRNGVPLAINEREFNVYLVHTGMATGDLNKMLLSLVEVFEKNGSGYCNNFGRYMGIDPISFNRDEAAIKSWQKNQFGIDEKDFISDPEEFFSWLRGKFGIGPEYTDLEAYKIMRIRYEILMNRWNFINMRKPILIASHVGEGAYIHIEERHLDFPGVITEIIPVRKYINAQAAAHVLGYVGPIDSEKLGLWKDKGYKMNDIVGLTGIELAAEEILRGADGLRKVEEDTNGRLTRVIEDKPAIPGKDIVLTIDMNLQQIANASLEKNINLIRENVYNSSQNKCDANAGAAVAIDVRTGEVLVMANYPTYDPSIFVSESREAQILRNRLISGEDENRPLFPRAISGTYIPGSVFKPIVSIAALEEGVITPETDVYDPGKVELGGMKFRCLEYPDRGHGWLRLERALATSCNIFFHLVGVETTIDKIDKWAQYFGLGELTGIELPWEEKGIRASREYKSTITSHYWTIADTAQASIGQLYHKYTPLQLANYVAAIANGGKLYKPHIIDKIIDHEGNVIEIQDEYKEIPVSPETITAVKAGMRSVAQSVDGTAEQVFRDFPVKVAGKTGTAETGSEDIHSSNALFVCYAPADDPQIAVAVVVERGVWGSYTAPIARDILEAYFEIYGVKSTNTTGVPVFTR